MEPVVTVFTDQFRVKARDSPIDDLNGIEWQPPDGQARARESDDGRFILFRESETEAGHADRGLIGIVKWSYKVN